MEFDLGTVLFLLGGLSLVITFTKNKFPNADNYFAKGAVVLNEIDDVLDGIIEEFSNEGENGKWLQGIEKVEDVVDKICDELAQAGYDVAAEDKQKIKNRVKGKVAKTDGLTMNYDPKTETTSLEYNKKF